MPEVSADSVDKIVWEDYVIDYSVEPESYKEQNFNSNIIEDKSTIKELFELLETGEKINNADTTKNGSKCYIMRILLYCSEIPAAYYELSIELDSGRIVCGKPITGYVYMPDDLLEKIAGHKIDLDYILQE